MPAILSLGGLDASVRAEKRSCIQARNANAPKRLHFHSIQIFGEFPQKAAPVIEKPGNRRFLGEEPRALLARAAFKRIPLMIGVNRDEASYFYPRERTTLNQN